MYQVIIGNTAAYDAPDATLNASHTTVDAGHGGRFTFRYHGDLRGEFVSGVTIRTLDFGDFISHQTSEFGRGVIAR